MKKPILFILLCLALVSVYFLVIRKDNQSQLDQEAQALRASLGKLSGEIAQIRLTAIEKEQKYNEVLASLTNYQPTTENEAVDKKWDGDKPIVGYWKCESKDTVTEWEFDYRNYTLNEDCNHFAWTSICYENKTELCIIFPTQEEYQAWLVQ